MTPGERISNWLREQSSEKLSHSIYKRLARMIDEEIDEAVNPMGCIGGNGLLDPDMPDQELRLHIGELTAQGLCDVRAAIAWANRVAIGLIAEGLKPFTPIPPARQLPASDEFDYWRVRAWALDPKRKPAITAFTAGSDRNAARLIEELQAGLWQVKPESASKNPRQMEQSGMTKDRSREAFERWWREQPVTVTLSYNRRPGIQLCQFDELEERLLQAWLGSKAADRAVLERVRSLADEISRLGNGKEVGTSIGNLMAGDIVSLLDTLLDDDQSHGSGAASSGLERHNSEPSDSEGAHPCKLSDAPNTSPASANHAPMGEVYGVCRSSGMKPETMGAPVSDRDDNPASPTKCQQTGHVGCYPGKDANKQELL